MAFFYKEQSLFRTLKPDAQTGSDTTGSDKDGKGTPSGGAQTGEHIAE